MQQTSLADTEFSRFTGVTIGKVSKVTSEANMVDIVLMDGTRLKNVQVMSSYASSDAGLMNLPIPKYDIELENKDFPLETAGQTEADVFAVVTFLGNSILRPIVLGFLFPEVNQVLCGRDSKGNEDGSMFLWKHDSNVYVRVAKGYQAVAGEDRDGHGGTNVTPDIEISHPSGTFIKIGNVDYTANHADELAPIVNWDKDIRNFKALNPVTNKADPSPTILINHSSGTYIVITPTGVVGVTCAADLQIDVAGNVTRTIKGDVTETIDGNFTRTVKGDLNDTIEGAVTEESTGDWDRTSNGVMNDKATQINHDSV